MGRNDTIQSHVSNYTVHANHTSLGQAIHWSVGRGSRHGVTRRSSYYFLLLCTLHTPSSHLSFTSPFPYLKPYLKPRLMCPMCPFHQSYCHFLVPFSFMIISLGHILLTGFYPFASCPDLYSRVLGLYCQANECHICVIICMCVPFSLTIIMCMYWNN